MPQMDGVAFLNAIRKDSKYASLKVVMCTAKEGDEVNDIALKAGADRCLPKPITFDAAQHMLQQLGLK